MKRVILLVILLLGLSSAWPLAGRAEEAGCKIECQTCASTCEKTLRYFSKRGGKDFDQAHINALKDCISACKQSADFMVRGSSMNKQACALCEQLCVRCAESCDNYQHDKTMEACAEECRKCAKSCHEMAN